MKVIKKKTTKPSLTSPTSSKKKEKAKPVDGLGTVEKMKLRNAMRQVWQRSKQWKMVKSRCKDADGYDVCEQCNLRVPKIYVDHIIPIGDMLDPGFIERLMVPSSELKGLCNDCHKPKTKKDNEKIKEQKKTRQKAEKDSIIVELDDDIKEMDLYTHEKIKLQEKRNKDKPSLEFFI